MWANGSGTGSAGRFLAGVLTEARDERSRFYLRNLELSEFSVSNGDHRFPAAGVVVVAGSNNAGKSALLSALDVLEAVLGSLVR